MTDTEIIDGLFRREEPALEAVQTQYHSYCSFIAKRILGNRESAEEVCSDVWLRVWQSIPPTRPENLRLYIGRITRNRALHYLEQESAAKRSAVQVQLEELNECLPDRLSEVDTDRIVLQQIMGKFLRSLSREKRVIFIRRYWYGDTIEQIAARCGCKPVRITGILYRIRKELRNILEKEEIDL